MSSTDTSGNRWEPTDDNAGTATLAAPDSTPANPSPPELDGPDTDGHSPRSRFARIVRSRGALGGLAVVLVLAAGAGGFALGHATAGNGNVPGVQTGLRGFDPDHDGFGPGNGPDGFGRNGNGSGQGSTGGTGA